MRAMVDVPGRPMQLGFHLPQVGPFGRDDVLRVARAAEDAGLSAVWVGDHLGFPAGATTPYPYSRRGEFPFPPDAPFLEALTTLAFVAGTTDRVAVGVSVLILPLREVVLTSRQLSTLAVLAPGRLVVGVGTGWLREEFDAIGADFDRRGRVLDDQLRAMVSLWSEPAASFAGAHVDFPPLWVEPRPDPRPAVWVGGNSEPALRRAGRLGDAWHAAGTVDSDRLKSDMGIVRAAATDAGRDPDAVALTVRTGVVPDKDGYSLLERRLEALADAGCAHVVIAPRTDDVAVMEEACWRVAAMTAGVA